MRYSSRASSVACAANYHDESTSTASLECCWTTLRLQLTRTFLSSHNLETPQSLFRTIAPPLHTCRITECKQELRVSRKRTILLTTARGAGWLARENITGLASTAAKLRGRFKHWEKKMRPGSPLFLLRSLKGGKRLAPRRGLCLFVEHRVVLTAGSHTHAYTLRDKVAKFTGGSPESDTFPGRHCSDGLGGCGK